MEKASDKSRVTIIPMGLEAEAGPEQTLAEVLAAREIGLRLDCGGKGRCGQCRVRVTPLSNASPLTQQEAAVLTPAEQETSWRLACQTKVNGPVEVYVPPESLAERDILGKTGLTGRLPVDASVERLLMHPPFDLPEEACEDMACWTAEMVRQRTGRTVAFGDPAGLAGVTDVFRSSGPFTVVCHRERGVTALLEGEQPESLGLAVDIGTTTIAAYLCDLRTGEMLASAGAPNPQRRFGGDVISRISFAAEHRTGLETMRRLVVQSINDLLDRCLKTAGAERSRVDEVSIVGNTTMQQIFCNLNLAGLGRSPFLPVSRVLPDYPARATGLRLHPGANVTVMPMISGFIGGDTVAAVLAERPYENDEMVLIVDIGTNGELVLGNHDGLWATSCATGPALEGACIECGMAAAEGAVEKVRFDTQQQAIACSLIGGNNGAPARGLCGSGVIDAAASMLESGALETSGRIAAGVAGVEDVDGGRRFMLVPPENSLSGRGVYLTQKDVRQIQLAKGALRTGIELLLKHAGVSGVDRLVLTGAFGSRFDWRNAVRLGMLPVAAVSGRVDVVENSAGTGAMLALLDRRQRREARDLMEKIRVVELNKDPDFLKTFTESMMFPGAGDTDFKPEG